MPKIESPMLFLLLLVFLLDTAQPYEESFEPLIFRADHPFFLKDTMARLVWGKKGEGGGRVGVSFCRCIHRP